MPSNIKQVAFQNGPQIIVVSRGSGGTGADTSDGISYACTQFQETEYGVKFVYITPSGDDCIMLLPWQMVRRVYQVT